jgi:hypothetical protein
MQDARYLAVIASSQEQTPVKITSRTLRTEFHDVRPYQDRIAGNVDVEWDLLVNDRQATLVNQDFVFFVRRQRRIFERITIVGGNAVRICLDIAVVLLPRAILLEMKAEGTGNSVVERRYQNL